MKPTTNFRDAHFDVKISQAARDKLAEAQRRHKAEPTYATYAQVLAEQHSLNSTVDALFKVVDMTPEGR
jgi:hypothetical protein